MGKLDDKISSYEDFVEKKLKVDLREVEALCSKKHGDYSNWQELQGFVRHIQSRKACELTTTFNLGLDVYVAARLERPETIIVNVGCGCFLEMYYAEAQKYIDLRMKYVKREVDFLRQQAANVKAHIKLVLLAINELKGCA